MRKCYKNKNDSNIFKQLRLQKNVSQKTVAESVGVEQSAVSKWERGETMPDQLMLPIIAEYYSTTVDALLGHMEAEPHNHIIGAMTDQLKTLSGEQLLSASIILNQFINSVTKGEQK